jgi:hypothetical protein
MFAIVALKRQPNFVGFEESATSHPRTLVALYNKVHIATICST